MRTSLLLAALVAASFTTLAQGPGPGTGPGPGPRGGARMGPGVAPGWAMMTPDERRTHHDRMRAMKDPAQCEAYMAEHHKLMQERAKQQGKALRWNGPRPFCEYLKKPA